LNRPAACHGADHATAENQRIPEARNDFLVDQCPDYYPNGDDDREPGRTQDHVKNKSDPKAKNGEKDDGNDKLQYTHGSLDLLPIFSEIGHSAGKRWLVFVSKCIEISKTGQYKKRYVQQKAETLLHVRLA